MYSKAYKTIIILFLITTVVLPKEKLSDNDEKVSEPQIGFDWKWGVAQLIPSPEWITLNNELKFGMRWQLTPVLYSFGMNRKLSPWRYFITDPFARQSGSVELFFTPEYLNISNNYKDRWLFRSGVRCYFPIWQKGEYSSLSFAMSYFNFNGITGISYEAGIYLFAGVIGFQTTYAPSFINSEWIFTIRLRYF